MSNINLCAVDPEKGYCDKCGAYVRDASYCKELEDSFSNVHPDTGDWKVDEGDGESFDIGDYLRDNG